MGNYAILLGEVLDRLKELPDASFHAILTDPPYGLGPHQPTGEELVAYVSGQELDTGGDFMGNDWHVPSVAVWKECLRVLKPGAPLLSFAGSRTQDLIALGLRAAGFEIRDTIAWIYGQGMPKPATVTEKYLEDPASVWAGYGHALRPSIEPIILALKPRDGTIASNVLKHGAGALNVKGTRIPRDWDERGEGWKNSAKATNPREQIAHPQGIGMNLHPDGGWPANVIVDEWVQECLGEYGKYFYCAKANRREREKGCDHLPLKTAAECTNRTEGTVGADRPQAGAGRGSGARNYHPNVKPISLTQYLAKLLLPPVPGTLLIPYSGSGSEIIGALAAGWPSVLGIERKAPYIEIARARIPGNVQDAKEIA